jgi:hypothetical protein
MSGAFPPVLHHGLDSDNFIFTPFRKVIRRSIISIFKVQVCLTSRELTKIRQFGNIDVSRKTAVNNWMKRGDGN